MNKAERDQQIITLLNKGKTFAYIAKRLGVSKGTIHNVKKRWKADPDKQEILNEIEHNNKKAEMRLIDLMQSSAVDGVVALAISKLNEQNINADINKYGIGNMYRLIGMFTDKTLAIKEYDIKLKQLAIKERELSIKEKELELRISNPEAFHEVHIINDAPREELDGTSPN